MRIILFNSYFVLNEGFVLVLNPGAVFLMKVIYK